MNHYPQPGEKWQFYKGGQYEIICMCNHTKTNEELVIYRSLSFGGWHARPYSEWHSIVESPEKYKVTRFSRTLRS